MTLISLALAACGPAVAQLFPGCPRNWDGQRVELTGNGDVSLEGRTFRVGGHASLDYMPRILRPGERPRPDAQVPHPLVVVASIASTSRDALGAPVFTCVHVTRGADVWARRPATYDTQTLADGYPPGASPPAYNEAWRLAVRDDGPEWAPGDVVRLEMWAEVHGKRYVFTVPPITLMRGG